MKEFSNALPRRRQTPRPREFQITSFAGRTFSARVVKDHGEWYEMISLDGERYKFGIGKDDPRMICEL